MHVLPHLSLIVGAELTSSCPEGRSTSGHICVWAVSHAHYTKVTSAACFYLTQRPTRWSHIKMKIKKERERNHLHLNLPRLLFYINLVWIHVISLDYFSWKGSELSQYWVSSISKHCSGEDLKSDVKNYYCFLLAILLTACEDFHISLQQRIVGFTAFSFHYLTQTQQTKTCLSWADLPKKTT